MNKCFCKSLFPRIYGVNEAAVAGVTGTEPVKLRWTLSKGRFHATRNALLKSLMVRLSNFFIYFYFPDIRPRDVKLVL